MLVIISNKINCSVGTYYSSETLRCHIVTVTWNHGFASKVTMPQKFTRESSAIKADQQKCVSVDISACYITGNLCSDNQ